MYVVDAEGKREASFAPFIDATLKGPDAVFALLRTYLQRLEITQADHVLFIADGAPWIWKRVPLLVQALGLAAEQVHELLDFYHAVQHLGQVAALRKDWSAKGTYPLAHATAPLAAAGRGGAGHYGRTGTSAEAATARRSARIVTTSSRTRAAWRMPSSWP